MTAERSKEKSALMKDLVKRYGVGNVKFFGDETPHEVERLSSSSAVIDQILGGGFKVGALHEIFGPESSGKTSLCLSILAQAQKDYPDKVCVYLDSEQSIMPERFDALGVDTTDLIFISPESAEDGLQAVFDAVESGLVSCVFIDSIPALIPKVEMDADLDASMVASRARLLGKFMPKAALLAAKHGTTFFLVNQERAVIGAAGPYGPKTTTPGGNSVRYLASTRSRTVRTGWIGDRTKPEGITQKVRVIKNKTAPPHREAEVSFLFASGYDVITDLVDAAVMAEVIFRRGAWYFLDRGDEDPFRLGQGVSAAREAVREDAELIAEIKAKLKSPK